MNKILKWFLIVLSSLLALVAVICGAGCHGDQLTGTAIPDPI